MTLFRNFLGHQLRILGAWLESSGRDVYASTRASVRSPEARTGMAVFAALWLAGLIQAGPWPAAEVGEQSLLVLARSSVGFAWGAQALLLLLHVAMGGMWGVALQNAWSLTGDIWRPSRLTGRAPWVRRAITVLVICLFHAAVLLRDLARHPALYQETFYARGVLPRLFQEFGSLHHPAWVRVPLALGLVLGLFLALLNLARRWGQWWLKVSRPARVAIGVLGLFLLSSAAGVWGVRRWQREGNAGPNLVVLAVEGLRGESLGGNVRSLNPEAPTLERLRRRGRSFRQCVPPAADPGAILMTFLTGTPPLLHGYRHPYPAAADLRLSPESLPEILRASDYRTVAIADAGGDPLSRLADGFDECRAPLRTARRELFRRSLERSVHLLPYVSGRWGRALFPVLRGTPALADPDLLAGEAESRLRGLRFHRRFFLLVYWTALADPRLLAGPAAWNALEQRGESALFFPGKALRPQDGARERALYRSSLSAMDAAVGRVLTSLRELGLEENTLVALWSPRAAALAPSEAEAAESLDGPVFFDAPFALVKPNLRSGARRMAETIRTHDLAPTLLRELGIAPRSMDGRPVFESAAGDEASLLYAESSGWGDSPFPLLPRDRLLVEDRDAPGRLTLDPAALDAVLIGKKRMIQWGDERLLYVPTLDGVKFKYYRISGSAGSAALPPQVSGALRRTAPSDKPGRPLAAAAPSVASSVSDRSVGAPEAGATVPALPKSVGPHGPDLAEVRAWAPRVRELKEIFYRYLARESGWRPQNEYWLPEAFLREEPAPLPGVEQ